MSAADRGLTWEWATQYYVAGRMAARAHLMPVYGNLLHHAIEMYVKSALAQSISFKDLKMEYGHDLKKLWKRFKAQQADAALDQFDATIRALHKFHDIRYPDSVPPAMLMGIAWNPRRGGVVAVLPRHLPTYQVFISDVDRLVIEVLERSSINPKFFVGRLGPGGRGGLAYQNPHAGRWRRRRR